MQRRTWILAVPARIRLRVRSGHALSFWMVSRRHFIFQGSLCLAGLSRSAITAAAAGATPLVRIGLMTDLHYADKEAGKTRFYREALSKLEEAVGLFNRELPDAVVELGDFIDQADSVELEMEWLSRIEGHYAALTMPRHYVLGNHCVGTLTKAEFASRTGSTGGHSSFETAGITFLLLDACFREDGVAYGRKNFHWQDTHLPESELAWIKDELGRAKGPVVVFTHQRLDLDQAHAVKNAAAARKLFEESGKVLAVFQGHSHRNDLQQIEGIDYVTLVAMVEGSGQENNGYAMLEIHHDGSLRLKGFRRQETRKFPPEG
jgi:predicted phosphodiesterase